MKFRSVLPALIAAAFFVHAWSAPASSDVAYFQCKYHLNSDSQLVPCFLIHSTASVQNWVAVFPPGAETAVVRVTATSDSMAILRTSSHISEFPHRLVAIDYIRRVLRYAGNLNRF